MTVYLDANCVIYLVELNPTWGPKVLARVSSLRSGGNRIAVGDLARTECLAQPFLKGNAAVIAEELERMVLKDLLGPVGGPDEEIEEQSVRNRYLVGMLAPKRQARSPEEFDELPQGGSGPVEDGTAESTSPANKTMFPSSFGMTLRDVVVPRKALKDNFPGKLLSRSSQGMGREYLPDFSLATVKRDSRPPAVGPRAPEATLRVPPPSSVLPPRALPTP
ncbi:MAG: hypothetical protein ACHRXM_29970 [Isosphaerales bacterium]